MSKKTMILFKDEQIIVEIAYNLEQGKTNTQIVLLDNLKNLTARKNRIVKLAGELTEEFELK